MVFGANGKIVWAKHNLPGSWHDPESSRVAQLKLIDPTLTLPGFGVIADSAFSCKGEMFGKIVTPMKKNEWRHVPPRLKRRVRAINKQIVFIRQTVEWGMGAIEKPF